MSKVLVSYFSASGVTKGVAEKIAKGINGELFEIEPVDKYTTEDLDWTNRQSRSSVEMNENIKPAILNKVSNLDEYDIICLGFPIWWYKEPTIIDKFLEENDMSNKSIYVFVTSGSSGVDSTYRSLKSNFPNLNFISGKRFTGRESEDEYISWLA
ncbi:MAG: NAD(P)H-dependent oxidoreductase [Clostridia bacterium]|nr:NAD(P)H-dependent oxidoreductase [Clostridia bacterium]